LAVNPFSGAAECGFLNVECFRSVVVADEGIGGYFIRLDVWRVLEVRREDTVFAVNLREFCNGVFSERHLGSPF